MRMIAFPTQTAFSPTADGIAFTTNTETRFTAAGTATVSVLAQLSGVTGNIPRGTTLNLKSPVAGVTSLIANDGIDGGADAESDEALLSRIMRRIQNPPATGTIKDYETRALSAGTGITRVKIVPFQNGGNLASASGWTENTVTVVAVNDAVTNNRPTDNAMILARANILANCPLNLDVRVIPGAPFAVTVRFASITPDSAMPIFLNLEPGGQ
ncbi:MAG: baseplate J/gp47 family protein [Alphaproteobacteria bacterium]|nr:baseplate J/gp47 family protein [Alphaproteobacteria bacterium]